MSIPTSKTIAASVQSAAGTTIADASVSEDASSDDIEIVDCQPVMRAHATRSKLNLRYLSYRDTRHVLFNQIDTIVARKSNILAGSPSHIDMDGNGSSGISLVTKEEPLLNLPVVTESTVYTTVLIPTSDLSPAHTANDEHQKENIVSSTSMTDDKTLLEASMILHTCESANAPLCESNASNVVNSFPFVTITAIRSANERSAPMMASTVPSPEHISTTTDPEISVTTTVPRKTGRQKATPRRAATDPRTATSQSSASLNNDGKRTHSKHVARDTLHTVATDQVVARIAEAVNDSSDAGPTAAVIQPLQLKLNALHDIGEMAASESKKRVAEPSIQEETFVKRPKYDNDNAESTVVNHTMYNNLIDVHVITNAERLPSISNVDHDRQHSAWTLYNTATDTMAPSSPLSAPIPYAPTFDAIANAPTRIRGANHFDLKTNSNTDSLSTATDLSAHTQVIMRTTSPFPETHANSSTNNHVYINNSQIALNTSIQPVQSMLQSPFVPLSYPLAPIYSHPVYATAPPSSYALPTYPTSAFTEIAKSPCITLKELKKLRAAVGLPPAIPGCALCMRIFDVQHEETIYAFKLPCLHIFHAQCLREWLVQRTTCPHCNYLIRV